MWNVKNMTRAWAEIDLAAIRQNYTLAKNYAKEHGTSVAAVVKANAYGHGAIRVAEELESRCLADFFAVATLSEAAELSEAGIRSPILILSEIHHSLYRDLVAYPNIIPSVYRYESAKALSDAAFDAGKTMGYFLVLDTGMSRIGLECTSDEKAEKSLDIALDIAKLPNISLSGIFSHLACADEAEKAPTLIQTERFERFSKLLAAKGINAPIKSLCNSAALTEAVPENKYDLVRQGITLYGLDPSGDTEKVLKVKPAMAIRARITDIKTVEAGIGISYGHTFTAKEKTVVATLPIGYADGYPRALSNRGGVLIDGKYAPILGRVCMDQLMVDVTHIPSASIDSVATLMGADERVRADRLADMIGTIPYELICGISPRMPRIYVNAFGSVNSD